MRSGGEARLGGRRGGPTPAIMPGERANGRRQATKARVDGGNGPLDLGVGEGRSELGLDEAELDAVAVAGRRNAGRRQLVAGSWSRRKRQGGSKWWTRFNHRESIRIGGGSSCALREEPIVQLGASREAMMAAVVAADARCRPKERKEETDKRRRRDADSERERD